jgi:hypothetical protein
MRLVKFWLVFWLLFINSLRHFVGSASDGSMTVVISYCPSPMNTIYQLTGLTTNDNAVLVCWLVDQSLVTLESPLLDRIIGTAGSVD